MQRLVNHLVLTAFLCCASLVFGQVTTATLYSVADSYTVQASASTNYGSADTLSVRAVTTTNYHRSFIRFDLSSIPDSAVILSAKLRLTPKGTENVTSSNSTQLYLDVNNVTWAENTITHTNQPVNNAVFSTVTTSNLVSSKREFVVTSGVQWLVAGSSPNFGWRLRRNPENTASGATSYYSKEAATTSDRPQLIVEYYIPMSVSVAIINHCSSPGSDDGSITPTVINGSSTTKTYRWYDATGSQVSTSSTLTGAEPGWYGMKVYGTNSGDTMYQAFIVGVNCDETDITFAPGPNYIDDAMCETGTLGSALSSQRNYGTYTSHLANIFPGIGGILGSRTNKSLVRFRLWMDPAFEIKQANLVYFSNYSGLFVLPPDSAQMIKVTENWRESTVTYNILPSSSSSINVAYPSFSDTITIKDIRAFWNYWKGNNTKNYGMLFQLSTATGFNGQEHYSSDYSTAAKRPYITFKLSLTGCNLPKAARKLTGINYQVTTGNFYFSYEEEYGSTSSLDYKVFDEHRNIVLRTSSQILTHTQGTVNREYGDNRYKLDVSSLATGTYTLELTNEKKETFYLRFTKL